MTTDPIACTITAHELVAAGQPIELTFSAAVDPQSAQGAIRLVRGCRSLAVRIDVVKRGRVVVVVPVDVDPGACELVVGELLGTKAGMLVDRFVLPFSIVPISGKVPDGLRVEHAARLVVGELHVERLAPGEEARAGHVDVVKAVDRATGEPIELAFDERGERVDIAERYAELAKRRWATYGRIHETLHDRIAALQDDDRVDVVVWPPIAVPPAPYEKPNDRPSREAPDGEQKVAESLLAATRAVRIALERTKVEVAAGQRTDDLVPCLRATATVAQIRALAENQAIGAILLDDRTAINDLGNSIAVARSDLAHAAGFDGTGIRVAVWEDGPDDLSNLSFAGRFSTTPPASAHARLTSAIVKNTQLFLPHGHAPDCDLFSANSADTDALRWAVRDEHCTVVSQSFHRGTEPGGSGLQTDDLLKDWLALRWPYPTIVQAAGNFWATDPDGISPPESEFVNHKGFNSLAVGNHDDAAAAMSGDSVFRNPTTAHGDRELPELAANGTLVSANGQAMSGTSFSAPAAAGVTALLQDVDTTLCSWPEGCRAILMAAAGRNVRDGNWWHDVVARVDGRDGAGAVDAQAGVAIAQQRRWHDAPSTRRGWDVGTLSSSLVGSDRLATFRYHVTVPILMLFSTVKVALAWDSAVTSSGDTATASTLTVDLDLIVRDSQGVQVASAASWDNSYEIAEFAGRAGETYEIVIRRWSGTDSVWYGVAWNVTGFSVIFPFSEIR